MTNDKILTLTRYHQYWALVYFLSFLSNLLELILEPSILLSGINTVSTVAGLAVIILTVMSSKTESADELSRLNSFKANSFVLSALTIAVMCMSLLTSASVKINFPSLGDRNLWLALFWFLGFSRNAVFLVYERLEKD